MNTNDGWTARWSCEKLISHSNIASAVPVGSNEIELTLHECQNPVRVATMSQHVVGADVVHEVYTSPDIEFIMNIPKDALFQQDALEMSELLAFGLGGLGDLFVAAAEGEFRTYVPKEFRFILRVLRQHSYVTGVTRINNRMLLVERFLGDDKLVLALNEYDLTAEAVRTGVEKFGRPDIILTSNPNCRTSRQGSAAAASLDVKIFDIRELMGHLRL